MKKIILLLSLVFSLFADDIIVYNNEYNILKLDKKVKKLLIGNREMINVSLLSSSKEKGTLLKVFGKKSGNTSILIKYKDGSIENYHVYVNENLGFIQKMINTIEPELELSKVGDGSTVISGTFENPHDKKRIYELLESAGVDMKKFMDLTETKNVNKMVRTKLYLVEINNQKAKDLGGVTGLSYFSDYLNVALNPNAANGATFSGWLLNNMGGMSSTKGKSITGTLQFLEETGIGKILDDTVLITTEDQNASFRVGGKVYIPVGITENPGFAPTIQLEEKEYGLFLNLTSHFMEREDFMYISIAIEDSAFDTNPDHDVQLGEFTVVPSFINKKINTNVVAQSGQLIALGGRMHTEDIDQKEKVPFLGDIPFLGELFTHTVTRTNENDLLFFLVPEIVDANKDLDDTHFYRDFKKEAMLFHKESIDLNVSSPVVVEPVVNEIVTGDAKVVKVKVQKIDDEVMIIETEEELEADKKDNSIHKEVIIIEEEPKVEEKKQTVAIKEPIVTKKPVKVVKKEKEVVTPPVIVKKPKVIKKPALKVEKKTPIVETEKVVKKKDDFAPLFVDKRLENSKKKAKEASMESNTTSEETELIDMPEKPKATKYAVNVTKVFLRDKPVDGERVNVWIKGHEFTSIKSQDVDGITWLKVEENCYKGCTKENRELWISEIYADEI